MELVKEQRTKFRATELSKRSRMWLRTIKLLTPAVEINGNVTALFK
jgi:hypothetical protein